MANLILLIFFFKYVNFFVPIEVQLHLCINSLHHSPCSPEVPQQCYDAIPLAPEMQNYNVQPQLPHHDDHYHHYLSQASHLENFYFLPQQVLALGQVLLGDGLDCHHITGSLQEKM